VVFGLAEGAGAQARHHDLRFGNAELETRAKQFVVEQPEPTKRRTARTSRAGWPQSLDFGIKSSWIVRSLMKDSRIGRVKVH